MSEGTDETRLAIATALEAAKRKFEERARLAAQRLASPPAHAAKPQGTADKAAPAAKRTGEFFAVDRRTWHRVCGFGMNASVAYLVLAKGTLRDNRRTSWSVNAVETYTGIGRDKASAAIEALIRDGAVVQTQGGTRPRYELPAWHELKHRAELTPEERAVFDRVKAGDASPWCTAKGNTTYARTARDTHDAALVACVQKGWLQRTGGDLYRSTFAVTPDPDPTPDLVWLPNAMVVNPSKGIPSILESVRQTSDPMALRLLVDLYSVHNLLSEGGIPRDVTCQKFERVKVGERGAFVVWGFKQTGTTTTMLAHSLTAAHQREPTADEAREKPEQGNAVDWFARMDLLAACGCFEWMPHLYESESPDASVIHPYGLDFNALDRIENAIGHAAHKAGTALLLDSQRPKASGLYLAPVPKHMASVAMVGIVRLRLKPYTSRTRKWMGDLHGTGQEHVARYARIEGGETNTVARPAVAGSKHT